MIELRLALIAAVILALTLIARDAPAQVVMPDGPEVYEPGRVYRGLAYIASPSVIESSPLSVEIECTPSLGRIPATPAPLVAPPTVDGICTYAELDESFPGGFCRIVSIWPSGRREVSRWKYAPEPEVGASLMIGAAALAASRRIRSAASRATP